MENEAGSYVGQKQYSYVETNLNTIATSNEGDRSEKKQSDMSIKKENTTPEILVDSKETSHILDQDGNDGILSATLLEPNNLVKEEVSEYMTLCHLYYRMIVISH